MTESENNNTVPGAPRRKKRVAIRVLKVFVWAFIGFILLISLGCSLLVAVMTPSRLTPLVQRYASEYLNAEIAIGRVELTFWHTFPRLTVEIDSLDVISKSLDDAVIARHELLPVYADSLLSVRRLAGGIDLAYLLKGDIKLYDLLIDQPRVNIVIADAEHNNFSIFPDMSESPDDDELTIDLPDITVDRFRITDASPIRYFSVPDSLSASVSISSVELSGSGAPHYRLSVDGDMALPVPGLLKRDPLTVGLDGRFFWNARHPLALKMSDVTLSVDSVEVNFNGDFDMSEDIRINSFDARLRPLPLLSLLSYLSGENDPAFKTMRTDMKVVASVKLTKPYVVTDSMTVPSALIKLEIPESHLYYHNIKFNRAILSLDVDIDGNNLDNSIVTVERLEINGKAMDVNLTGTATSLISDPLLDMHFIGDLRLDCLPRQLLERLPFSISGRLSGDAAIVTHSSYLSADNFHKMRLSGKLSLDEFNIKTPDSVSYAYISRADMKFGTTGSFMRDKVKVDSLLTVSLSIDSTSVMSDGITINVGGMKAGVGTINRSASRDTSAINPFGGVFRMQRFSLNSRPDSLLMRLRDVDMSASLRRFKGQNKVPEINFNASVRIAGIRDHGMRLVLAKPEFGIKAHIRSRNNKHKHQNRSMATDSAAVAQDNVFEVDSGVKALVRRWDISGELASARVGMFIPEFPLRQSVDSLLMKFSTDSIELVRLHYRVGESEMDVTGKLTNIRRVINSRRRRSNLTLKLDVNASLININELSRTAFNATVPDSILSPEDSGLFNDEIPVVIDTVGTRPVLVPVNLVSDIDIKASKVIYSDLNLHDLTGQIEVANGAVNLRDLSAKTEIGNINLTALYSAPDTAAMQFGVGMKINNFHIDRMKTVLPAVDSLLPVMREFRGIINADIAATSAITPQMDFNIPSLKAAVKLEGDSLVLLDADTFKMLSRWLMFKDKKHNMIDHMSVEIVIEDSQIEIYPFMFDIDRYRLGVMGRNDLAMNLDYHVSVLKSPLPFKFGINVKGNVDNLKIRLGGAKYKEDIAYGRVAIADTTRINLLNQIENVFRRSAGVPLKLTLRRDETPIDRMLDTSDDVITRSDSVMMMRHGLIDIDSAKMAAEHEPDIPVVTKKKRK